MFWIKKPTRKNLGLVLEQLDERRCLSAVTVLPTDDYSTDQVAEYRADPPQPDKTGEVDPPDPDKTGQADPPGVIVGETSNAPWGWGDPPTERAAIYMNEGGDGLADPPTERAAIYMNDAGEKMGPIFMNEGVDDSGEKMGPIFMNEVVINFSKDSPIVGDPFVGDPFVGDPFVGDPKR